LPPPVETPYSEIQRMLEVAPQYGIEFVLPKTQKLEHAFQYPV
jgi:hypothetical protein